MKKLVLLVAVFIALLSLFSVCTFAAEIEGQRWHIGLGYEAQSNELTIQSDNNAVGTIYGESFTFKAPTESVFIDFGFNLTKNLEWNFRYSESAEANVFSSNYTSNSNYDFGFLDDGEKIYASGISITPGGRKLTHTSNFSGSTNVTYKTEGWRSELVYQIPYNPNKSRVRFKVIGGTYRSKGTAITSICTSGSANSGGYVLFDSGYSSKDIITVKDATSNGYHYVMNDEAWDDIQKHGRNRYTKAEDGSTNLYAQVQDYLVDINGNYILKCGHKVAYGDPYYVQVTVIPNDPNQGAIEYKPDSGIEVVETTDGREITVKKEVATDKSYQINIIGPNYNGYSETVIKEETKIRGDYIGISAEYDIVKNLWLEVAGRKVFNGYARNTVTINGISDSVQDDNPEILMLDVSLKAKFVKGVTMKFGYQKTFVDYTLRGSDFSDKSSAISLGLDWQW